MNVTAIIDVYCLVQGGCGGGSYVPRSCIAAAAASYAAAVPAAAAATRSDKPR